MTVPVLLLTHSEDFYTPDLIASALSARGQRSLRVNTDRFPTELGLEVYGDATGVHSYLSTRDERIELEQVPAIWYRRLYPGWIPDGADDVDDARAMARRFFIDAFRRLNDATWVNDFEATERAENKLLQLHEAAKVGLPTPRTLVTNHPEALRQFHATLQGRMVTKLLEQRVQSMGAHPDFVYTTEVLPEHMSEAAKVQYSPQIFQALVPKQYELRIVVVGEQTFAGAIDASSSEAGQIDWRRATAADGIEWRRQELPSAVAAQVVAVTRRLGLTYSAVDIIVDDEDRHVFLELNPAGEWGWLQRDLGLPIAEAIADALIREVR